MTASLVSSLIQLGLIILTPFYFFARNGRQLQDSWWTNRLGFPRLVNVLHSSGVTHKKFQGPTEETNKKKTKGDIPVHTLIPSTTDSEKPHPSRSTSHFIEWCSVVSETLTVLWLIFCINLRKLWIKLCLSLMFKQQQRQQRQQMDAERAMPLQDFNSEERKFV